MHHEIRAGIADRIRTLSNKKGHTLLTEFTLPAIATAIQDYQVRTASHRELQDSMLRLADADLLVEAIGITDGSGSRNRQGTTTNQQRQQVANEAQSSNSVTQSTRQTTGKWVKPHNPTLQLIRPTTVRHNQHTGR